MKDNNPYPSAGLDLPPAPAAGGSDGDIHERIRARMRVLALEAGRVPPQVSQEDYEQAKQELAGPAEEETECDAEAEVGRRFDL